MKDYGGELAVRTYPVRPASMDLSGDAGRRIVMVAAKRVMMTNAATLKALAQR